MIAATRVSFSLPLFPPTVNNLFANAAGGGRFKTRDYASWCRSIDGFLQTACRSATGTATRPKLRGPVAVDYVVARPDKRRRDLDNLLKALNDILTRNWIIEDDALIERLAISWAPRSLAWPKDCKVRVEVQQISVL